MINWITVVNSIGINGYTKDILISLIIFYLFRIFASLYGPKPPFINIFQRGYLPTEMFHLFQFYSK